MPEYAVIAVGGKQYRVREGERLLVDRLAVEPGETFSPNVLAVGGDKAISDGGSVTARVEEHVLGKKIVVFTYRARAPFASVANPDRIHRGGIRRGTQKRWRLKPQRT
jgi:large subunit ribosomal protein L21